MHVCVGSILAIASLHEIYSGTCNIYYFLVGEISKENSSQEPNVELSSSYSARIETPYPRSKFGIITAMDCVYVFLLLQLSSLPLSTTLSILLHSVLVVSGNV